MGIFSSSPKQPTYADQLRAKKARGEVLNDDEKRTLAAIGDDTEGSVWASANSANASSFNSNAPHCPKCRTENIQLLGQNRKAFSAGKAIAGGLLTGGVGTLAGFAGKKGRFQWVCMDCGNRFEMK